MKVKNTILIPIIGLLLISCYDNFDNSIAEKDIHKYFPESEILELNSYVCDGTFGDCFYVNVLQYMGQVEWTMNPLKTSLLKEDREKLRKLGLCICLYKSNPNSDFWKNEGSASGYVEMSNIPIDAIRAVEILATEFSKKKLSSYADKELTLMKCLDFYHSNELDSLVAVTVREL
jgi:hypothetical protein